ncbi:MAG TPA: molybdate ABC transporter substrate-binding protein [Caulobacteraceae bacterium]|jgi:molybdate transport system substrate-binding protein
MTRRLLSLVLALLLAVGFGLPAAAQGPPAGGQVTIFAAASLKNALDQASAQYAKETGTPPARISYAASSALARQIEQGAPADLYISADTDWMDYLAQKKLIRPGTRVDLFTNHLALIGPKDSAVKLIVKRGFPLAQALGQGRLAMAGPEVPAGKYGQASLTALGVWDQVKDKTARGENVRATLQFVARGEAPLGIVYDTDALSEPSVKIVGLFPDSSHPKIVYPGAALTANPQATAFLGWLHGPKGAAAVKPFGFVAVK